MSAWNENHKLTGSADVLVPLSGNEPSMEPLVVSVGETRRLLGGLSVATVYRFFDRGLLDKRKIGSRTVVTMRSIRALVEHGKDC